MGRKGSRLDSPDTPGEDLRIKEENAWDAEAETDEEEASAMDLEMTTDADKERNEEQMIWEGEREKRRMRGEEEQEGNKSEAKKPRIIKPVSGVVSKAGPSSGTGSGVLSQKKLEVIKDRKEREGRSGETGQDQVMPSASSRGIEQAQGVGVSVPCVLNQSEIHVGNNGNQVNESACADENQSTTVQNKSVKRLESFINVEGRLVCRNDLSQDRTKEVLGLNRVRFEEKYSGICKVIVRIRERDITSNKNRNYMKILVWCNKNKVYAKDIVMARYNMAYVIFNNGKEANDFMDKLQQSKEEEKILEGSIDNRTMTCKGVITDWPYDIKQLWEEIVNKDEILGIDRMRRKSWNRQEKKVIETDTGNLIITMKGHKIKDSVKIFDSFNYNLRVRPYIEPVKQCYKCYRYGHVKAICKSEQRCRRCSEIFHGVCQRDLHCRNCEGEHEASARICPIYLKNKEIKRIMAHTGSSFFEADKLLRGESPGNFNNCERFSKPVQWPSLPVREGYNKVTARGKDQEGKKKDEISTRPDLKNQAVRKILTPRKSASEVYQKERAATIQRKSDYRNDYYKQFDYHNGNPSKGKRGIALKQYNVEDEVDGGAQGLSRQFRERGDLDAPERRETPPEIMQFLTEMLKIEEVKKMFQTYFNEPRRSNLWAEEYTQEYRDQRRDAFRGGKRRDGCNVSTDASH